MDRRCVRECIPRYRRWARQWANQHPELVKGFDLRGEEEEYRRTIRSFLEERDLYRGYRKR